MGTSFRKYEPDQALLFPASPSDWLPEGHLAFFIADTVGALDLGALYALFAGDGRRNRPFDPGMMLRVLIYAYATGTFSSRRIAAKLHEDVAFRYLAAENFPAHRTIAEFRQRNLESFSSFFVQVLNIAQELGLVKLGTLAIDGTKVKANASRYSAMSYGRMVEEEKRLKDEIAGLAEKARQIDEQEDQHFGADRQGDELPEELVRREDRLSKIEAARKRLEHRQAEADRADGREIGDHEVSKGPGRKFKRPFGQPEAKKQENFTDPESRIMKTSLGFDQCFNAQIAVDEQAQIIVATLVSQSAADAPVLVPVLDEVKNNTGIEAPVVLVDAGYKSEANFVAMEARGIEGYVAQGRGEGPAARKVGEQLPASLRMRERMATPAGAEVYRKRKRIVEPVFGWIKACMRFRSFSLRGLNRVQCEWDLVCLALNLKRISRLARTS